VADGPGVGRREHRRRRARRARRGGRGARRHRGQPGAGEPARPGRAADGPAGARHPARAARRRDRGNPAAVPGAGLERRAGLAGQRPRPGARRHPRAVRAGPGRADRPLDGRSGGVPGGRAPVGVGGGRAGPVAAADRAGGPAGGPPGPARAWKRRPHHQPQGYLGLRRARPGRHRDGGHRGSRRRAHDAAPGPALASAGGRVQPPVAWAADRIGRRDGGLPAGRRGAAAGVTSYPAVSPLG